MATVNVGGTNMTLKSVAFASGGNTLGRKRYDEDEDDLEDEFFGEDEDSDFLDNPDDLDDEDDEDEDEDEEFEDEEDEL